MDDDAFWDIQLRAGTYHYNDQEEKVSLCA